jgi:hypothetical protein
MLNETWTDKGIKREIVLLALNTVDLVKLVQDHEKTIKLISEERDRWRQCFESLQHAVAMEDDD